MQTVNIEKYFEKFNDTFSPKIVGNLNGQNVLLVKLEGDKVPWHTHDCEDEMFFVFEGELDILEKNKTTRIKTGEFYIVQKGIEHKIIPIGKVKLILFEPENISHTGNVKSEITLNRYEKL